jgi:pimeloyl-ACP methyl ester carboxylesterase
VALDIRYARSGGVSIAYQVVGQGDVDLLYVPDYVSNLVYGWETPYWRRFYEQLAERFRLILFDKRGTGLSDLGGQFPALETRMDDVRAVLDAVDSSTAVLLGSHDGCSMAALYAATYPERTRALVLFHPVAHDPTMQTDARRDELAHLRETWGTQELADEILAEGAPSLAGDPDFREWFTNWLRVGASPSVAYALNRAWFETDLRDVLPSIRVPTLVLYRDVNAELSRDVADRIPGAKATRVSGTDYGEVWLSAEIPDELERFVAGEPVADVPDTVLSTVLFTDIVGSSAVAARLGDRAWRQLLERHHALVRRELALPRRGEGHGGRRLLRHVRRAGARDPLRRGDRQRRRRPRPRGARGRAHGRMRAARGQGRRAGGRDRGARVGARARRRGLGLADGEGPRRGRRPRACRARRARTQGRARELASLRGGRVTCRVTPSDPESCASVTRFSRSKLAA